MALKIGLIGIVGEEMKKDPWGTLGQVAKLGYQGVEGAGGVAARTGIDPAEFKTKLAELGLDPIAQGLRLHAGEPDATPSITAAKALGCKYVIQYWGPCESAEQLKTWAKTLDSVGKQCRDAGLTFCYHNHNHEFAKFGGKYGLDILMENTDPSHVAVELDVAWVTYGGADPVEMILKYAGRCPVLHMKDLAAVPAGGLTGNDGSQGRGETQFTEVGTGVVDIAGVVAAARDCGVEWLVVEQDRMNKLAPMDSIRVSYENLKRIVG